MKIFKTVLLILILIMSIGIVSAYSEPIKFGNSAGGGKPNNEFIDGIKNAVANLAVAILCPTGYSYCYELNNIYGDAQATARVFLSEPYIQDNNLYINYKGEGTKYYVYRGLTSWSQVHCDSRSGCDGTLVGSNSDKYLLGSYPSKTQQSFVYVAWDYNEYNGYWSSTWTGYGWFQPFTYDLNPTPVYTTPSPVYTTQPTQYVCSNGQVVSSPSSCPTVVGTQPSITGNSDLNYTNIAVFVVIILIIGGIMVYRPKGKRRR